MDPLQIGLIGIAVMLVALMLGVPIAAVLGLVGIFGTAAIIGWKAALGLAAMTPFHSIADYGFAALVLFLMMGMIIQHSGATEWLYDSLNKWLSRFRGGLLSATFMGGAFFGACSGSSLASCALFGRVAVPHLVKHGYHRALACGAVTTAGTLAALIPPSGLLIIYGILTETSIGHLFMGGLLPGILNILLYAIVIFGIVLIRPKLVPRGQAFNWGERVSSLRKVWPIPLIGIFVICAIYFGIATPTEVGGIGAFLCLIVALVFAGPRGARVPQAMLETARDGAMILLVVVGAILFGRFLALSRLPTELVSWIEGSGASSTFVMLGLVLMYLIMGTFMGAIELIVITTPVVLPVIIGLGFSPVWWGVVLVQLCEIGLLTPPIGMMCYITKAVVGDLATLGDVFKGAMLFAIADFALLALIILYPQIILFLPGTM